MNKFPSRYLFLLPLAGVILVSACDGSKLEWPKDVGMSSSPSRSSLMDAFAQTNGFEYVANFVCGTNPTGVLGAFLPGHYETEINIYNRSSSIIALTMRVSPSISLTNTTSSPLSGFVTRNLDPFRALAVDCGHITAEFVGESDMSLITGTLAIQSGTQVRVFATYTAGTVDSVESIHVEQIPAL